MGQFKPMVKMETTEPSVILKLKKGGHVASKHADEHGHTNMKGSNFMSGRNEEQAEKGASPKKPSMAERRNAMSGALMSKKGGKVAHKALGGAMGAPMGAPMAAAPIDPRKAAMMRAMMARRKAMAAPAMAAPAMAAPAMAAPAMKKGGKAGDAAQDKAMIKKAFKQHDAQEHMGAKGTKLKLKNGGNAVGAYVNTKVVDGDKTDKASGTGKIKMGKPAGYKAGGTIEGNAGKFAKTKVVDGDKADRASGTGGVRMGNAGGFAEGGLANRPADTASPGVTNTKTGEVKEANAGGYKKGGSAKKAFATGGSVNNAGHPVAYPAKPVSKPVSNDRQSGTFKKGGKVQYKDVGGKVEDLSGGAYDASVQDRQNDDMRIADAIRNAPANALNATMRLLGKKPGAGAGRGFVNPPMARKGGGMC